MADTAGQALLRGRQLDKISKDYFNEALIFKNLVSVSRTTSREIRWYQKTSGFLVGSSGPDANSKISEGAIPFVLEQSWTRNTSQVQKYLRDSPMINMEDESDSEVKVFLDNLKDLTESVAYDVDSDIWNEASENQSPVNLNSVTCTAAWDAASGQDPMEDVTEALMKIRQQTKRKMPNPLLLVSAKGEKDLKVWITSIKGSSWSELASKVVVDGVLARFGGCKVIVSENVTADYAWVGSMKDAVEYKQFVNLQTAIIEEKLVGRKIRVCEEGVAILEKPKYGCLLSNTEA